MFDLVIEEEKGCLNVVGRRNIIHNFFSYGMRKTN